MAFFNKLFSADVASKTVDAIVNTGDAIFYTPEEKAKAFQLGMETKLKMLPMFEAFKLVQRHLALLFSYNFIFSFWVGVLIFFYGTEKQFSGYLNLVAIFQLGWIMIAIITFYFGGGFVNSFKGVKDVKK